MQQRRFLLFMVLSFGLLFGWMWMQQRIWPPQKKKDADPDIVVKGKPGDTARKLNKTTADEYVQSVLAGAGAVTLGNLPGVAHVGTAASLNLPKTPFLGPFGQRNMTSLVKVLALPEFLHLAGGFDAIKFGVLKSMPMPRSAANGPPIILGDDKSFIKVELNRRGGGVQRLTLPRFQQASDLGQPVTMVGPDGKTIKKPLDLIAEDPHVGSFMFYHYSDPESKDSEPLATLGDAIWKVEAEDKNSDGTLESVTLSAPVPGQHVIIKRKYTLKPRDYHVNLEVEIVDTRPTGGDRKPHVFRYQLAGGTGIPIEGEWYTSTYRNPMVGLLDEGKNLVRDLDETQHRISHRKGGEYIKPAEGAFIQFAGVVNQYFGSLIVLDDQQAAGIDIKGILAYAVPTLESEQTKGRITDIALDNSSLDMKSTEKAGLGWHFELLPRVRATIDEKKIKPNEEVVVSSYTTPDGRRIATDIYRGKAYRKFLEDITVRVVSNKLYLKPGERVIHRYMLYNGPAKVRLLSYYRGEEAVDPDLVTRYADTLHLRTLTDYRSAGPFGWFSQKIRFSDLLIMCTRLMHWLLDKLHWLIPNYGLAIIALTVLVRGLMFPISRKQALLSIRMQAVAPEMKKLREKYKDNPQAQQAAIMELYRKHKVNPLAGCLPLFLQMPIFLGLYYCLQESIHFRLAGFLYMDNLAAPDMLKWWGEGMPWLTEPDNLGGFMYLGPFFNILPVFAVGLMLVQQKMMTPPPTSDEQEMQQKMMKWMMVIMGVMFYKVAAGLCVYFIVGSLWGLAEKQLLPKGQKAKPDQAAGGAEAEAPKQQPTGGSTVARRKNRGKDRAKGGKEKPAEPDTTVKKVKDWWQEVLKQAKKK